MAKSLDIFTKVGTKGAAIVIKFFHIIAVH